MKRMTVAVMGFASLVMVLALGISAGAVQAHTFEWSGENPSLLLILADGPQVFQPFSGGPIVTCKHAHFDGKTVSASQLTETVLGEYTNCEAFGSKQVKVSPAEYEISADQTVSVLKAITIESPGLCKFDIPSTGNTNLKELRYLVDPSSGGTRILAHAEVTGITSTSLNLGGGEGLCGATGEHKTGIYHGLLLAWVHGTGTLKWS